MNAKLYRAALALAPLLVVGAVAVRAGDAGTAKTHALEYVLADGRIYVYSIDAGNTRVATLPLPPTGDTDGVVACPATATMYISWDNGDPNRGSLLAYDLVRHRVVWERHYDQGVDSMGISRDCRTLYMPAGEQTQLTTWRLIRTRDGRSTGTEIHAGVGPHNTIVGASGKYVYLAAVQTPYLEVASTALNKVVRKIGPLHGPGVRPFTINGSETLAFTTARSFLGFQVSDIRSGKVLYSVPVPGFTFDPASFGRTPDHGISLSPDESELYLIDTPNGYVHVFDVRDLPKRAPRDVADIKLRHPPPNDGWLQHSRDGRFVYVGRAGDVIDTRARKVVAYLPPLQRTADFLEIDWRNGKPVATTNRYGVGYR